MSDTKKNALGENGIYDAKTKSVYIPIEIVDLNNKTKDVSIKDCVPTLKCKQYLNDEQKKLNDMFELFVKEKLC